MLDVELTLDNKMKIAAYLDAYLKKQHKLTYDSSESDDLYYTLTVDELNRILEEGRYVLGTKDEGRHYLFYLL